MELIQTLPHGSVIEADETGSWFGNRDYLSNVNRVLSRVTQTFRFKRLIVLWNVPLLKQVDTHLRSMGDATIETVQIHRKVGLCECKFKYAETNAITSQTYRKYPVLRRPDGSKYTVTRVFIGRPSAKFRREYVPTKEKNMNELYAAEQAKMREMNKPKEKAEPNAECDKCHYEWFTKSEASLLTCPSCGKRSAHKK